MGPLYRCTLQFRTRVCCRRTQKLSGGCRDRRRTSNPVFDQTLSLIPRQIVIFSAHFRLRVKQYIQESLYRTYLNKKNPARNSSCGHPAYRTRNRSSHRNLFQSCRTVNKTLWMLRFGSSLRATHAVAMIAQTDVVIMGARKSGSLQGVSSEVVVHNYRIAPGM